VTVSRRTPMLVLVCALFLLPACATTSADDEIRKLEARASYEAGVKNIAEGRISFGLAALRQAVEIEPGNALYRNAVGAVMLNIGRYPEAQAEFLKFSDQAVELAHVPVPTLQESGLFRQEPHGDGLGRDFARP